MPGFLQKQASKFEKQAQNM